MCKQLNQKQVAGSLFSGQSINEMLKKFDFIFVILSIAALPALRQKSAEALHRERALFKEILCILKGKTAQECIKGNAFSLFLYNFNNLPKRKKIIYIYPNI